MVKHLPPSENSGCKILDELYFNFLMLHLEVLDQIAEQWSILLITSSSFGMHISVDRLYCMLYWFCWIFFNTEWSDTSSSSCYWWPCRCGSCFIKGWLFCWQERWGKCSHSLMPGELNVLWICSHASIGEVWSRGVSMSTIRGLRKTVVKLWL